jgi:DNA-binding protein WhiA
MNFTSDVKKEIIARGSVPGRRGESERKAAISAFLRTSGDVGLRDGAPVFYFVSETENVAEFFMSLFVETFGVELYISHATMDKMSKRDKLVLQCPSEHASTIAKALGLVKKTGDIREGIDSSLISTDKGKISYIRGAFLGGGSCTIPTETGKAGYHLEVVFSSKKIARDFCELLADFELLAKLTDRKESSVVYIKSKELISDFLAIIGAENCLRKFSNLVEKRDRANNDNRARNCIAGNADKAAIAAVKQVVSIEKLKNSSGFSELSSELKSLAKARLENPSRSLQELANKLGISKSCLNHRMRKLMELAGELD